MVPSLSRVTRVGPALSVDRLPRSPLGRRETGVDWWKREPSSFTMVIKVNTY